MGKAIVINGSPQTDRGKTAMLLAPFIQGMVDGGSEVELFYASRLKVKPCSCGQMRCWDATPGECSIQDGMQDLYPKLKQAELVVLATPVYIPLPGEMQNFINRLCPLIDPVLVNRDGRTRARMHDDVKIQKFVLVATSGWWELGNFDTVIRIVRELAEDADVDFGGAVLRPHANSMMHGGVVTTQGRAVLDAAKRAGFELAANGEMNEETLMAVSQPLIPREEF